MQGLSDVKQRDWIRACRKLGLDVDCSKGKGSHCLILRPGTPDRYTLQKNLYKIVNEKIFRQMVRWGFAENQIETALR